MKKYMIGEVAKILGLSVHTLRYYEKHDIIKPSYIDDMTGYRYYTVKDVEKLSMLKECKRMDFSLDQIRRVSEAASNEEIVDIINEKKKEVTDEILHNKVTLENIEWYLKEYDNAIKKKRKCYVPFLVHLDSRKVIYKENPYEENSSPLALAEIAEKQLEKVDVIAKKYGFIAKTKSWNEDTSLRVKGEYVDLINEE